MAAFVARVFALALLAAQVASLEQCDCEAMRLEILELQAEVESLRASSPARVSSQPRAFSLPAVAAPARSLRGPSCPEGMVLQEKLTSDLDVNRLFFFAACPVEKLFVEDGVTSLAILSNPRSRPLFTEHVKVLRVVNTALESLEGLEGIVSVSFMMIQGNARLSSLSGLRNLEFVQELVLANNAALASLAHLESLMTVEGLVIQDNPNLLTLLGSWGRLGNVGVVTVSGNEKLHSLTGFEGVTDVEALKVQSCPSLKSVTGFRNLQQVTDNLLMINTGLESLTGLENLTVVRNLDIQENPQLSSLIGLESLMEVEDHLRIEGNPVLVNLSGLEGLRSAGAIHVCDNNGLKELDGLDHLTQVVDSLSIQRNAHLASLSALQDVENIGGLITIFDNWALASIAGLGHLPSVKGLHISGNRALQFLELENLTNVELELKIENQRWLFTFAGLENLVSVGALHLTGLQVNTLSHMRNLAYAFGGVLVQNCETLGTLYGLNLRVASQLSMKREGLGNIVHRGGQLRFLGAPFAAGADIGRVHIDEALWPQCITQHEHATLVSAVNFMEFSTISNASWQRWHNYNCSWSSQDVFACAKGQRCILSGFHVSKLQHRRETMPGTMSTSVFVSNLTEGCGLCSDFHLTRNRTLSVGGVVDFGYILADEGAGHRSICWCTFGENSLADDALMGPVAELVLRGPTPSIVPEVCSRGHSCTFKVEGVELEPTDRMVLMNSCEEGNPSQGFEASWVAKNEYRVNDTETWFSALPTRYELCWKALCNPAECPAQDRYFLAGTLELFGAYTRNYEPTLGDDLLVPNSGFGVVDGDRMRLRLVCGEANENGLDDALEAHSVGMLFDFGALTSERVRAGHHHLCWCQVGAGASCVAEEDFMAVSGVVKVLCPAGEEPTSSGECRQCPAGRHRSAPGLEPCTIQLQRVALFAAFFFSVAAPCAVLVWVPRRRLPVVDVSLEEGRTMVTIFRGHHLSHFGRSSLPVKFQDTGHPGLCSPFRAQVQDAMRLELLTLDGKSIDSRLDTSIGTLTVTFPWDYYHQGRPVPVLLLLLLLVVLTAALSSQILASETELALVGGAIAVVVSTAASAAMRLRPKATPLVKRLLQFKRERLPESDRNSLAREKGPERAISIGKLHELLEYFHDFIRDRTAYYLDTCVIRPLTKEKCLSYAELAGAGQVEWFVSHFWGTPFQHFCTALRLHAQMVCSERSWSELHYWVCFCANNQHHIEEELGASWKDSSFYIALKSGHCQGTCMVLDDKALPLTRIWCIFELLQTYKLERTNSTFQGLLFCTSSGVLNTGRASVDVAMALSRKVAELDLETARASNANDELMIRELVVKDIGSFAMLNAFARGEVRKMLVRAQRNSGEQFSDVVALLGEEHPGLENV